MAKNLSQAQQKELKDAFDTFDTDRSGMISSGELSRIFKALNLKISQNEVERFVSLMDSNGSGQIEFDEFCRVMAETLFKKYSQQELRQAFNQFDQDRSGYIQANELESVLRQMGRPYSHEQIEHLIQSLDKTGDGKIGFEEFTTLFE